MELSKEVQKLFKIVRTKLGAPIRKVELTDEMLCDLLSVAVGDYAEKVQNFMIENNWPNLYGKNLTQTDFAYAMSVRTLDITRDYSYYFSKEVGLQQRGPWELKKDFFTVEKGKQVYVIPAGREICKVMFTRPATTQAALFANFAGLDIGFGGGYAQLAGGTYGGANSMSGYYTMPAYDIALLSADLSYKNQLLRSDLVYKVTAGPNGTHLIHLMSTPGSRLSFDFMGPSYQDSYQSSLFGLVGSKVFYYFYETTPENVNECRKNNPDVLLTPDQVPLDELSYEMLNPPTQAIVRQLLVAEAASTLGIIRGTFSGAINMMQSPLQMDYNMLSTLASSTRQEVMTDLKERLDRMNPYNVMSKQAQLVQDTINAKKGIPLPIMVI